MPHIKKLFIVLLLTVIAFSGYSQTETYVYLKNGEVVSGTLKSYTEGEYAVIVNPDGEEVEIATSDIDKLTEQPIARPTSNKPTVAGNKLSFDPPGKGFYHTMHAGMMIGQGINGSSVHFTLTHTTGYHFNERWAAGVGLGLEAISKAYIPFYAEGRFVPFPKSNSLYAQVRGGFNFTSSYLETGWYTERSKGGPLGSATIGFRSMSSERTALELSIGYRYQLIRTETTYTDDPGWWGGPSFPPGTIIETFQHMNRIEIKIGLLFH